MTTKVKIFLSRTVNFISRVIFFIVGDMLDAIFVFLNNYANHVSMKITLFLSITLVIKASITGGAATSRDFAGPACAHNFLFHARSFSSP
jgi:hypothetical protein